MIVSLKGILAASTPLKAVIECGGLGYEVHIPVTTAEKLPQFGQSVHLHTYVVYREDSQTLYGFSTAEERDFFQLLVEKVSGVGPRVALSLMSKLSLHSLRAAIASGDVALLARCPGIGKKTAERLVVELKDKVGLMTTHSAPGGPAVSGVTGSEVHSAYQDALLALVSLGYKPADADKALRKARETLGADAATEDLIRRALN
jgi:holliday junction DNA helicase RuvA